MTMKGELRYAQEDDLQILELPYTGGDLSMLVLLPSQVNGLGKLEASLTLENLNRWSRVLRAHEVQVFLPKFKIEFPMKLNETLKAMGMQDAFECTADFSGLDGSKLLFIKAVLHKAFVEVNEEGTEAAAATAVVVKARSMGPPPAVFRADHPFVFLIRENLTGNILFLGRLVNPTA
jgi:serpin B